MYLGTNVSRACSAVTAPCFAGNFSWFSREYSSAATYMLWRLAWHWAICLACLLPEGAKYSPPRIIMMHATTSNSNSENAATVARSDPELVPGFITRI